MKSILNIIIFILIIMVVIDCMGNMEDNKSTIQNIVDYAYKECIYIDSIFSSQND